MNALPLALVALLAVALVAPPPAAASPVVACVPDHGYQACASHALPGHACAWVKKGSTTVWRECVILAALP